MDSDLKEVQRIWLGKNRESKPSRKTLVLMEAPFAKVGDCVHKSDGIWYVVKTKMEKGFSISFSPAKVAP